MRIQGHFIKKEWEEFFYPWISWTILYAMARLYYFKVYTYNNEPEPSLLGFLGSQFKSLLFNELSYHMYFISIILGLYLITPFVRAMVRNLSKNQLEVFLLFSFLIIALKQFYPSMLFVSHFQIGSSLLYFLLGHYFHTYDLTKVQRIVVFAAGIFAVVGMTYGNHVLEYESGRHADLLYQYDGIFVMLLTVFVFVSFKYAFKNEDPHIGRFKQFVLKLSQYSYGIYISHPLIISFLWYGGFSWLTFSQWEAVVTPSDNLKVIFSFNGAWGAVVMTLIVFSCSALFLYFVDKMKALKFFS